ncbi:hypothetical protein CONPUDRAFT_23079, partial [Coniophora puteana RWD-64-598 SS2]
VGKCQVAVSDGVTIGHYVCRKFRCTEPLESNADHFCKNDQHLAGICAVADCDSAISPTSSSSHTCSNIEHQELEIKSRDRGRSMFTLK